MSGQGRKTSSEGGGDDWFDLLFDDDTPAVGTRAPAGGHDPSDATNPARPVPTLDVSSDDSWDLDPGTQAPVARATHEAETPSDSPDAHDASDEFIDFGAPSRPEPAMNTPAFGHEPAEYGAPLSSNFRAPSSTPRGLVGGATGAGARRSAPATMMFGAPSEPVHSATRPQSFVTPSTPIPMVEAPPASTPAPPRMPPSAGVSTVPPVPLPNEIRPTRNPLRGRTPLPRAPVRSRAPTPVKLAVPPPPGIGPFKASTADAAIELDPGDFDFEDVEESLQFDPTAKPTSVPPPVVPLSQKATPVVPLSDVVRDLEVPMIPPSPPAGPPRRDSRESPATTGMSARREMHERFELGDLSGALSLAESLLSIDTTDEDACDIADTCRSRLRAIYVGRLGSLDQVPVLLVSPAELRWLALDHRAGFVLSLIDGASSVEDIIDVSTMPQMEVLRTLYNLITQNVISLRRSSSPGT